VSDPVVREFRRLHPVVEAMQYDGTRTRGDRISAWSGGAACYDWFDFVMSSPAFSGLISKGDYVVRESGAYSVASSATMERIYFKVELDAEPEEG